MFFLEAFFPGVQNEKLFLIVLHISMIHPNAQYNRSVRQYNWVLDQRAITKEGRKPK